MANTAQKRRLLERLNEINETVDTLVRERGDIEIALRVIDAYPADEPEDFMGQPHGEPKTLKDRILEEMTKGALPMTKAEIVNRIVAKGYAINEVSVGSTMSKLVNDGVLRKVSFNQYAIV